MAEGEKYDYLVNRDTTPVTLVRLGRTTAEVFCANGEWIESPRLNDIRYGYGPYMEYDDIPEGEAMEMIRRERERYDRKYRNTAGREDVQENLKEWLENPSWAEYYNSAPTDRCREYIALEFRFSETEDEETCEEMDRIENEMDAAELRHLLKWCGNSPGKGRLAGRIAELESRGKGGNVHEL